MCVFSNNVNCSAMITAGMTGAFHGLDSSMIMWHVRIVQSIGSEVIANISLLSLL